MADAAEPFSVIPTEITSNLRLIQWTELSVRTCIVRGYCIEVLAHNSLS